MKQTLSTLFVLLLCISVFAGCDKNSTAEPNSTGINTTDDDTTGSVITTDPQSETRLTAYGYVLYVAEDGFVASINGLGDVFVKDMDTYSIEIFDTAIIKYYEDNLLKESGTFIDRLGETRQYSYTLKASSVRIADPSNGDLVFG